MMESEQSIGKCQVPMWMGGCPSGHCGELAYGEQLPIEILEYDYSYGPNNRPVFCFGSCCPKHGGPKPDEIRYFQDGTDKNGRRMWCAVYPDFNNLQESPAGFDTNAIIAREKLKAAQAMEAQRAETLGSVHDSAVATAICPKEGL